MPKLITTTGCFNTGSSAVTNILQEFTCINCRGNVIETRLLYDTDCISDLEYNLVDNPHRHNTSNAIKKFKRFVDFSSNPLFDHHYEKIFNGKFKELSYQYIKDICAIIFYGSYYGDVYLRGRLFWFLNRCYQKIIRLLFTKRKIPKLIPRTLISRKELTYAGIYDEKRFLEATKNYISNLLSAISAQTECYLIDQFMPPTNIQRYLRYIPNNFDTKIFIVDRDPIDLYLTDKYFLHSGLIPSYDVNIFCEWFLWTRGQVEKQQLPKNVVKIQFEDLIYNYDETRDYICNFVGVDVNSECNQFSYFDPKKSVNNTQLLKRFKNINYNEIDIIRTRLKKYCYDFPLGGIQPDYSKKNMFDC